MVNSLSRKETILVKQYFKSVIEKRLTDAGRVLDRLEQTATDNNWKKGYIKALKGIFLVLKSRGLRYAYIGQIHKDDPKKYRLGDMMVEAKQLDGMKTREYLKANEKYQIKPKKRFYSFR